MTRFVLAFERCEARKKNGERCQTYAREYVKNPGAVLPMQVCGVHKRSGEAHIRNEGHLPRNWGKYS